MDIEKINTRTEMIQKNFPVKELLFLISYKP